jgi:hypothetical protein
LRTGATRELLKNISFFLRILLRFSGDIDHKNRQRWPAFVSDWDISASLG